MCLSCDRLFHLVVVIIITGAVHGFAAVLGGQFENAPHGVICACLLPFVFEKNAQCLQEKAVTGDEGSLLHDSVRLDALVSSTNKMQEYGLFFNLSQTPMFCR